MKKGAWNGWNFLTQERCGCWKILQSLQTNGSEWMVSHFRTTSWWKFKWKMLLSISLIADVCACEIHIHLAKHLRPFVVFLSKWDFPARFFLANRRKSEKEHGKQSGGVKWWTFLYCKLTNWEVSLCELKNVNKCLYRDMWDAMACGTEIDFKSLLIQI